MDGGVTPVAIFTEAKVWARNTAGEATAAATPAAEARTRRREIFGIFADFRLS